MNSGGDFTIIKNQLLPGTPTGEKGKNTFRGKEGKKAFIDNCIHLDKKSENTPNPLALDVNPLRLNERLSIQQGVFLCLSRLDKSFEDNLLGTAGKDSANLKNNVIKFVTPYKKKRQLKNFRKDNLLKLHRMNISTASLFPGLDGFCHSLRARIIFDELLWNKVDARDYHREATLNETDGDGVN